MSYSQCCGLGLTSKVSRSSTYLLDVCWVVLSTTGLYAVCFHFYAISATQGFRVSFIIPACLSRLGSESPAHLIGFIKVKSGVGLLLIFSDWCKICGYFHPCSDKY